MTASWNFILLLGAFFLFLLVALSAFTDSVNLNEVGFAAIASALFVAAHHQFPPRG